MYKKVKKVSGNLKNQFRNNVVTAVLAAFGLVIALVWRDVIQSAVDLFVAYLGLENGSDVISKLIVAFVVTLVCVIGIFIFSRYKPE